MKHVIALGRFNPPTIGHSLLLAELDEYSKRGYNATLFVTSSMNKPQEYRRAFKLIPGRNPAADEEAAWELAEEVLRNPLSKEQKIGFLEHVIQEHGYNIEVYKGELLVRLNDKLFWELVGDDREREVIVLAGADRVQEYTKFAEDFNEQQAPGLRINIQIVEVGKRKDKALTAKIGEADGAASTKQRYFAILDDFEKFRKGVDGDEDFAWDMFNAVKAGMEIPEEFRILKKKPTEEGNSIRDYLDRVSYYG